MEENKAEKTNIRKKYAFGMLLLPSIIFMTIKCIVNSFKSRLSFSRYSCYALQLGQIFNHTFCIFSNLYHLTVGQIKITKSRPKRYAVQEMNVLKFIVL